MSKIALSFDEALDRKAPIMLRLPGDLSEFFGKMVKKGFAASDIPETQKWIKGRESVRATKDKSSGPSVYCDFAPSSLLAFENAARRTLGTRSRLFISFADHYIPFNQFKMGEGNLENVESGLRQNDPKIVLYQHSDYRIGMPRLRKDKHDKSMPFVPYIQGEAAKVKWLPITELLSEEQIAPPADSTDRYETREASI